MSALTTSSLHSEVGNRLLDASGLPRRPEEMLTRLEDSGFSSGPLAPARGIVVAGIVGTLLWIALISVGYFLAVGAGF